MSKSKAAALANTSFDYASLSAEKAAAARSAAERIRGRMQLAAESIIEVGRELIEQKGALGHSKFMLWVECEFDMSQSSANKMMTVARELGDKFVTVTNLGAKALYALASPSTPPEVRAEVEDRASKGEKITAAEIEELKKQLAAAQVEAKQAEDEAVAQAHRAELAETANDRLSDTVTELQDEVSRLSEDGVIHVAPSSRVKPAIIEDEDDDNDCDDDVSPRAAAHRAKIAFLLRADTAQKLAFFPPDQKPDKEVIREAELTLEAWKSLVIKLKNGE